MLATICLVLCLAVALARAELYIVSPASGSTCQAGQPCTVNWLDDGNSPKLASIGVSRIGLYMDNMQLVQSIEPVDVSATHSMTFTPNPEAGPDADSYYLVFTSTALTDASGAAYTEYSPFFRLTGMSGTRGQPVASLTSELPVPSTLTSDTFVSPVTPSISTVTVGTLSTSLSPIPSLSATSGGATGGVGSSSRMSTSRSAAATGSASASPSASAGTNAEGDDGNSNGAGRASVSSALAVSCVGALSLYMICAVL
ncbi:uncharacterized protein SCHCODRAFT_02318205 [Schizophyllum commune H4-8]|uniref:Yeast cell wall synthesis Kre9/Knh1-like N-terminal domain-containing protein n=1 Tax=Schizophyllum commune (strain H4-8 / FGSC 9210) TaxID=578458 RepID=D8Q7R0_SCHCM|nr:uncharacterized protein SCHCODRAFT_02318205 [Schizophyllum commune H4-8]KAI5891380.1 hypothetical protein SCHCODRAFT_02318205 [Schizophyllum commune H4-8]